MNVQVTISGTTREQRGQKADLLVYTEKGDVYSKTTMVAGQVAATVVVEVPVPTGGFVALTKFVPEPVYDAEQRAAVPGVE